MNRQVVCTAWRFIVEAYLVVKEISNNLLYCWDVKIRRSTISIVVILKKENQFYSGLFYDLKKMLNHLLWKENLIRSDWIYFPKSMLNTLFFNKQLQDIHHQDYGNPVIRNQSIRQQGKGLMFMFWFVNSSAQVSGYRYEYKNYFIFFKIKIYGQSVITADSDRTVFPSANGAFIRKIRKIIISCLNFFPVVR